MNATSDHLESGSARWATFDCYGTLIDWNRGLATELGRVFRDSEGPRLLTRYHELEPLVQRENPAMSYRDVMASVLSRLAEDEGIDLAPDEADALGRSLPSWPAFAEVPAALAEARDAGWRLVILSNTDRDFIEASMATIGVPFEFAIVASEIGSYKPARRHWEAFFERSGADRARHVHVAASVYHDIRPAVELGLNSIWINRPRERADVAPTRELPDLAPLATTLDELVAR
jgi:2-haloacid dehalogenase